MSETIGFIGVGLIGSNLAKLAVDAGYKVVLSNSRGPESLQKIIKALGPNATAKTALDIATDNSIKIVVFTVPLKVIPTLGPEIGGLKDKIVIDTNNYYPQRDGHIAELDSKKLTTAEYVASYLDSSAKTVKIFNNISSALLLTLASKTNQTHLPFSGDDDEAKKIVGDVVKKLGYATTDAGKLKDSWKYEPNSPYYGVPFFPTLPEGLSVEEQVKYLQTHKGTPITNEQALELLNKAKRDEFPVGGIFDINSVYVKFALGTKPFGE